MTIKINTENQNKKKRIDLVKIKQIAQLVLKSLGGKEAELNIIFVSNQKIRALNRMYLGVNRSTDVLAFPFQRTAYSVQCTVRRLRIHDPRFFGDIAISSDKAVQNAKLYSATFMEEIALYVIHGILHLAGYNDRAPGEKKRMRNKEHELQKKFRRLL